MDSCSKPMQQGCRWWSRTSTPTASSGCSNSASSVPVPRSGASSGSPPSGACVHPATADTGVATWGGASLPGRAGCGRVPRRRGHPGGLRVRPGAGGRDPGRLHRLGDAADRRRPRPAAPAPPDLAAGRDRSRWSRGRPARSPRPPTTSPAPRPRSWTSGSPRSCRPAGSGRSRPRSRWRSRSTTPSSSSSGRRPAKKGWHVTLTHPKPGDFAGTCYLDVAGDTLDLTAFHDLVCDQAAQLKALGDTDDLEVRKAKALGVIASQQATLDLLTLTGDTDPRWPRLSPRWSSLSRPPSRASPRPGSTCT